VLAKLGEAPQEPGLDEIDDERDAIQDIENEEAAEQCMIVTPPDSFVTKYVNYASQRTDAPPVAHTLMALGLLSALAGPKPRLPIATVVHGWSLTLWVMYIVNSTTGRKSSTIDYAVDIAVEVLGREAVIYWEGSPQAVLQKLAERDGESCLFVRDEYSGLLGQMNKGGHMAGLAQTFIRAFDGAPLENNRTKKRNKKTGILENDTDRAEHPFLAKLCASTWDSFTMRATIDNVLDGFLARFITATGAAVPRRMARATPELDRLREALIEHARQFHLKTRSIETLDLDDDVLELSWILEQEWSLQAPRCSRPDAAGPALKRLADSVLKVAALLSIDSAEPGAVPRVTASHFEQARMLGARWLDSTMMLIDALGRTAFQQDCQAVLTTVRSSPGGVPLRDLYRKHQRLKKRDFDEILAALYIQEEIRREERKGETKKRGPKMQWIVATRKGRNA
jgi:hypothetical protein